MRRCEMRTKMKKMTQAEAVRLIKAGVYDHAGVYVFRSADALAVAEGLDFDELNREIDLPNLDLEKFATFYMGGDVPVGSIEDQSRLDQKKPVRCPSCGNEFTP